MSRYINLASNLEGDVQKACCTISELTNESSNLREATNKYKEYVHTQLPMGMDDVIALRDQVASLEPLKDQVRNLEQELDSLRREVIIPAGTFDSAESPLCSPRSGSGKLEDRARARARALGSSSIEMHPKTLRKPEGAGAGARALNASRDAEKARGRGRGRWDAWKSVDTRGRL